MDVAEPDTDHEEPGSAPVFSQQGPLLRDPPPPPGWRNPLEGTALLDEAPDRRPRPGTEEARRGQ
ncbi:hypothetical protein [Phycicoccus avicenniae]|uniref:hypothetical protein n=1 Tax=Phycicoccus avicenniae TaxID=2828860 RepID=UPI003D27D168